MVSIATWVTDAFIYHDGGWYYNDTDWISHILANTEVYFCIPLSTVTYVLYTQLIIMIFWVS